MNDPSLVIYGPRPMPDDTGFCFAWNEDTYTGDPPEIKNIQVCSRVAFAQHWNGRPFPNARNQLIWRHGRTYPTDPAEWQKRVIWDYCMSKVTGNVWAEFGVSEGNSARFFLRHLPHDGKLYLLDSFEGIPEDWNGNQKGTFACDVPDFNDPRAIVVKGWFEDTAALPDTLDFVHIDCDLYSSTVTILNSIKVRKGTIILFDELWGYPEWRENEYKALMEWDRPYKFIVRDTHERAAIEVL